MWMPRRRARIAAGGSGGGWDRAGGRGGRGGVALWGGRAWGRGGGDDRRASEDQAYLIAAGLDVVEGEAADRRGLLGVEQDEQPGGPVLGPDAVVVQQPARLLPAGLGVDDPGRAAPPGGWEVSGGQFLVPGPADEVPGRAALAEIGGGHPLVEAGLGAAGQGETACGQPVPRRHGRLDGAAGDGAPPPGGGRGAGPAAAAGPTVPARVPVQGLLPSRSAARSHG